MTPKTTQVIAMVFDCLLEFGGKTIFLNLLYYFGYRIETNQSGSDLEASSMLVSFHDTTRCFSGC